MGYSVCPKCNRIIGKAFWEVFTACPDCGEPWPVAPGEEARTERRVVLYAVGCAVLSLVPVLGILFGLLGILMGLVACRLGRRIVGIASAIVAGAVGLIGQAFLCWWGYGHYWG